eukprot:TRINITY_DN1719_c0_g1_i6.p1 TRINITY_DN1719_c0_g1~~TRINITY_DN1719_c0_g1_i6.p1  ORF type:complete len:450 (+),score=171.27 TRINITY_DN1719_c0_g1_i6:917-2266(+)
MKPAVQCVFYLSILTCCTALIHDLKIRHDNRKKFFIENFGFESGGELHVTIKNFRVGPGAGTVLSDKDKDKVGFVVKRSKTDSAALVDDGSELVTCPTDERLVTEGDFVVQIDKPDAAGSVTEYGKVIKPGDEGFYNIYFVSCLSSPVSFELRLEQFNVDAISGQRSYLSAGEAPLPTLYGVCAVVYLALLAVWAAQLVSHRATANRVHLLMAVLLALKLGTVMFEAIQYHFIKTTGSGRGWSIVYYIFAGLKGTMLFVLIALIGSGWTFIKPFLSDKDKKIFAVVIPLQLLDNIAMIVLEETAPGSQGWITWKDIFRLVDIICCGAILIPIIWSIKHLREASNADGKAARNLAKLKLFRQFYLMVVTYIYFTRIIVYLVDATLPFRFVWLGVLFSELAALAFYVMCGYKFRPADSDFFRLADDDDDDGGSDRIELEAGAKPQLEHERQ